MARTVLRGRDDGNAVLLPDYLHDYPHPRAVRTGLDQFVRHYNDRRPHMALDYATPAAIYFGSGAVPHG